MQRVPRRAPRNGWWPPQHAAASGLLLASLAALSGPAAGSDRIDNFVLLDHRGKAQELYYHADAAAVVIMAHARSCPAAESAAAALSELEADYPDVRFWLMNPEDSRPGILASDAAARIRGSILEDTTQLISKSLGFEQAGELIVVDPSRWAITYRGDVGHARAALDQMLADQPLATSDFSVSGCDISYRPSPAPASYAETIAPMLEQHCAYCHVEGGIGPWAMTGYDMVRGFAPMIREVVRTKRMPPWHADPHVGRWQGDRSLSTEEIRQLVGWIDAGAPRGNGPDPLEDVLPLAGQWPLGKPDLVVEIPGFEVPASGVVDYQFPYVKNELDHGVWITAATVLPGDRRVVHHVLAGSVESENPSPREDSVMDNYIIGYAPGAESYVMPEGTGVYVKPGGYFTFQMHYTPIGKVVVDNSKMGLYLSEAPPENFLRHMVVVSPILNIPPNTPDHEESAYYEFHDDVVIHTLFPHSHYRGRSSVFEARYPDGRQETLLSVPNYDFNWQRGYNPVTPIRLPAGSRLIHRTVYDNSAQNPANPDPEKTIHWGLQSFEEMLYGAFSYSWANETTERPIHDPMRSNYTQFVGFVDRNMDGKVSWHELPERMKKRLVQGFKAVDTNGDGGLDVDEFLAMQKLRETSGGTGD
jgi:mono/diheme cytochrome c family protein